MVELLIVIALLGVIAVIVIAAINPIEQANRARDTRLRADGAQLISAIDRYYASRQEFPWETTDAVDSSTEAFGFVSAADPNVGICGDATCSVDGVLLESLELKSEFRNRPFIKAKDDEDKIFVGKARGASQSIYACFVPASRTTRENAVADDLVYSINPADGSRGTASANCTGEKGVDSDWAAEGCYVCVPE